MSKVASIVLQIPTNFYDGLNYLVKMGIAKKVNLENPYGTTEYKFYNVGPEVFKWFLSFNTSNWRPVNIPNKENFKTKIRLGAFRGDIGNLVMFAVYHGVVRLIDGQHKLLALVEENATLPYFSIMCDYGREVANYIDDTKSRTAQNALSHVDDVCNLSSLDKVIRNAVFMPSNDTLPIAAFTAMYQAHKELIDRYNVFGSTYPYLTAAALRYAFEHTLNTVESEKLVRITGEFREAFRLREHHYNVMFEYATKNDISKYFEANLRNQYISNGNVRSHNFKVMYLCIHASMANRTDVLEFPVKRMDPSLLLW